MSFKEVTDEQLTVENLLDKIIIAIAKPKGYLVEYISVR